MDNIVTKPAASQPTVAELLAKIALLESRQSGTKAGDKLSISVAPKGGVSVYGLGRFPVTLYQEQWPRLLSIGKEITQFIADNQAKLATKPVGYVTQTPAVRSVKAAA